MDRRRRPFILEVLSLPNGTAVTTLFRRDSSCRPHEIIKLRIKDVVFKMAGDRQYAEILVNGKTGQRHIPLINSIPYLKDWLDDHPQRGNPNAPLICGYGRSLGRFIHPVAMTQIYHAYQTKVFSRSHIR